MKRMLMLLAPLTLLFGAGCGPPLNSKDPVLCEAIAMCLPGSFEVANCDGLENCESNEVCGTSVLCAPRPNADDFNQSCELDADCALIDLSGPCCTQCADEAVHVDAVDDIETYLDRAICGLSACDDAECVGTFVATCDDGTCVARQEPTNIVADDYDGSCSDPSDCTLINEGDPCECHVCADAAINADAIDDYNDDVSATMCDDVTCPAIGCGEEILAVCSGAGTCEARQAVYVEADDFDRSCEIAADCVAVYEGEVCSACQCPNAAINVDDAGEHGAALAAADCRVQECPCLGAAADCVDNICVFVE